MVLAPAADEDGNEMARPADRHSMSIRQPCPARFCSANDPLDRNEHVRAPVRTIWKGCTIWQMPAPDVNARMVSWYDGYGDPKILALSEMVFRVE